MNKTIETILRIRDEGLKKSGNFDYGANVIPVIKYYQSIKEHEKRKEFITAIEEMLKSENVEHRNYAVNLCLGFVTFKDAI